MRMMRPLGRYWLKRPHRGTNSAPNPRYQLSPTSTRSTAKKPYINKQYIRKRYLSKSTSLEDKAEMARACVCEARPGFPLRKERNVRALALEPKAASGEALSTVSTDGAVNAQQPAEAEQRANLSDGDLRYPPKDH